MSVVKLPQQAQADIKAGKTLLEAEAQALQNLANKLDATFSQAVDLIVNLKGRVIVTGMGKSGHIGAKIAATLASTGTPAFFVHPGEASHGDLGMITEEDAVIALSHSGETKELGDVIAYCQRFSIPLIAITGHNQSTLGEAATLVLNNQVSAEACPIRKAPTTSSTASLAMGDALAVALMERRGFSKENFATYHPGGKLGSQLLRVADIMAKGDALPLCSEESNMADVIVEMTQKNLGGVGITNAQGQLVGIITDGDLKRAMGAQLACQQARR